MKNLNDLRTILFEEIANLKNSSTPEALSRASAINSLAQSLIGTAKVEVDFLAKTGSSDNCQFIKQTTEDNQLRLENAAITREKTGRKW